MAGISIHHKTKILNKLYSSGCKTEKELQALSTEKMLEIPNITIPDIHIIIDIQKATKSGKLYSYLGGFTDVQG